MSLIDAVRGRREGFAPLRPIATRAGSKNLSPVFGAIFDALAPRLLFLGLAGGLWEIMARAMHSALVPSIEEIARASVAILASGAVAHNLPVTFERVVAGLILSALTALPIGLAMGLRKSLASFFEPGVLIGLAMPGLAWSLMTIVWFGASNAAPIVAVVLSATPALAMSIQHGVKAIDADLLEMTHVFKFGAFDRTRYLYLPSLTPFLLGGLRLGFSLSWKVVVISEIFGLSEGVGYQLNSAFSNFDIASMFAWTFVFTAVMVLIEYGLFKLLDRRADAWRREAAVL